MKILLTGSVGFIGSHIVQRCSDLGWEVIKVDWHEQEPRDFERLTAEDFEGIDVIVHCAAYVSVTDSVKNPDTYFFNNVGKLAHIIQKIPQETKIVFFSTGGALYGNRVKAKEEDASLANCTNPYAVSKLVGEWLVSFYHRNSLILRLGNVFGDGQDQRGEANVFTHFYKDDPIVVYDGQQTRDFVEVDVVVEAVVRGIEKDVRGTFNIGSGKESKIMALASDIANERGVSIDIQPARSGEVQRISLDTAKAQKAGLLDAN